MVCAVKVYQMLMGSSILLSTGTISLILSFTSPRRAENAIMILCVYAFAPSLALIHHTISSLCSQPDLPRPQTRQLTNISVTATRKQIASTTNLLCLALIATFVISSGLAVLVQSMVEFASSDLWAQQATVHIAIADGSKSVAAATGTGLKESLVNNALVLQALLQILQGIVLTWMFGVAAQEARIVTAIERGLDPIEVMVQIDVEQGRPRLSYDESDEDEDK